MYWQYLCKILFKNWKSYNKVRFRLDNSRLIVSTIIFSKEIILRKNVIKVWTSVSFKIKKFKICFLLTKFHPLYSMRTSALVFTSIKLVPFGFEFPTKQASFPRGQSPYLFGLFRLKVAYLRQFFEFLYNFWWIYS